MTVPAIAAMDVLLSGSDVDVGEGDEVSDGDGVLVDVGFEVEVEPVAVEDGEALLRHVMSSVIPTVLTSEVPPLRPTASTIVNNNDVPAATLAVQLKVVDPMGGWRTNDVPPGIVPMIVTG
jgi:hypothetical protein